MVSEPQGRGISMLSRASSLVYGRSQHGAGSEPVQGFLGRLSRGGRFSREAFQAARFGLSRAINRRPCQSW